MIIGICGDYPGVEAALRAVLPAATFTVIEAGVHTPRVDVLVPITTEVGADLLDATRPRLVQQFGVGVQNIDAAAAADRGIDVQAVPAANGEAVAEAAVMLLLMCLRRFPQTQSAIAERRVSQPVGSSMRGRTVAVLGTGVIGMRVLELLRAFGARGIGIGRRERSAYPDLADVIAADDYYKCDRLADAARRADAIVVCCPLTEETAGLIDHEVLAAMPEGGHLINVGRAGVVDRAALLDALRSGRLRGAGLDVTWEEPIAPDDELFAHDVVVTPHIGGVTTESIAAMAEGFAAQVARAGIA